MVNKFIGSWQLINCKLFNFEQQEIPDPFHNASGLIVYTKEGSMSAQIMQNYAKDQFIKKINNLSQEDYKELFHKYIAYYGTYNINNQDQTITHKVIGALWPQMIEKSFTRSFEFKDEDTLILTNTEYEAIGRHDQVKRYLTWQRIKV